MKSMCRRILIMLLALGMVASLAGTVQAEAILPEPTISPVADPDESPDLPELPEWPVEIPSETFPPDTEISGYDGDISWRFDGNQTLTISGNGAMRDYEYNNRPAWYSIRDRIENLVVEEGVTHIGNQAFQFCGNLKEAALSDSIRSIGGNAFWCCESLMTIELPNQLERIGVGAFLGCNKLQSVHIPSRVSNIEEQAFNQCSQLHCIDVDASNPYYRSIDGVLLNKAGTVLLCYPAGKPDSVYQVPEGVAEIDSYVFDCCYNIVEINFPESVRVIGDCAFNHCEILEKITLREGLERIGFRAFMHCHGLKEIILPASVKEIGDYAFDWCNGLVRIDVCSGNTFYTSEDGVLFDLQMTRLIRYPANKPGASYAVPASVTRVEDSAFALNTELVEIALLRRTAEIGRSAFYACSGLQRVSFSGNAPEIAEDAFSNTNLTACYPENNATWTSNQLQSYGGTVTWQPYTPAPLGEETGTCGENLVWKLDCDGNMVISGTGEMDDYVERTRPWSAFREDIKTLTVEEGVMSIGHYAFNDCPNLHEVNLPEGLMRIGGYAFSYCPSLESIQIPEGITWLSKGVLKACTNLRDVRLPNTLRYMDSGALKGCTRLETVDLPAGLIEIQCEVFLGCENLTTIALPDGVEVILENTFDGCINLTDIKLPENLDMICADAFRECGKLKRIDLPETLRAINQNAFHNCVGLTEVRFTGNRPDIAWNAFTNVIATVYYPHGNRTWLSEDLYMYDGQLNWRAYNSDSDYVCGDHAYWAFSPSGVLTIYGSGVMDDYIWGDRTPWAVYREQITRVIVSDGITYIGRYAFADCPNLKTVTLPRTLESIGGAALRCAGKMTEIIIPDSVTELGSGCFNGCELLEAIVLPEGITEIPHSCFSMCTSLRDVTFPKNLETIGADAFEGCSGLNTLALPDGLTYIANCAFLDCPRLSSLEIPDSVISIATYALGYYRMPDWTYQAAPDFVLSGRSPSAAQAYAQENGFAFTSTGPSSGNAGNQLCGKCGEDVYWNLTDGVLRISGSGKMTDFGDSVAYPIPVWCREVDAITSIVVEEGVTRIGDVAFWWLENVRSVTVAASVREIGDNAFYGMDNLQQVTFLGNPSEVGERLFSWCRNLPEIRIPEGISIMPERMFDNCEKLRTIYIPESVTQVEQDAFKECASLTDVYFAGTKEQAKKIWFAGGNQSLVFAQWHYLKPSGDYTTLVLPGNLTTIQAEAFAGIGAELVIVPASVNVIESRAFADCRNLQVLVFEDSPYSIAADILSGCSGVTVRTMRGTAAERWARINGFAVEYP